MDKSKRRWGCWQRNPVEGKTINLNGTPIRFLGWVRADTEKQALKLARLRSDDNEADVFVCVP